MFRKDGDLPVLRECFDCGHEFHTDGTELGTRRPITCPHCGKEVPYCPSSDPLSASEPPEF